MDNHDPLRPHFTEPEREVLEDFLDNVIAIASGYQSDEYMDMIESIKAKIHRDRNDSN